MLNLVRDQRNANYKFNETKFLYLLDLQKLKSWLIPSIGKDVAEQEPLYTIGENVNWKIFWYYLVKHLLFLVF